MLNVGEKKRIVESGDHVVFIVDCWSCFLDPSPKSWGHWLQQNANVFNLVS